jgi:hypothetical protein
MSKIKFSFVAGALLLSACSYNIMDKTKHTQESGKEIQTVRNCSYAPLWLAPMNKDYASVCKLMKANNIKITSPEKQIVSIDHKVYPFVLFTKSCIEVKYYEAQ